MFRKNPPNSLSLRVKAVAGAVALCSGMMLSAPASADVLIIWDYPDPPENDCAGVFGGTGGTVCNVGFALTPAEDISPIIAKQDIVSGGVSITANTDDFPSITGDEFTIGSPNGSSGTWSYTQGIDDPDVRYWVAKGGSNFRLHWMIDETDEASSSACIGVTSVYNLDCLLSALVVTSGDWSTPGGAALSHMTWYDTEANGGGGGNGNGNGVPEPATVSLIGLGLLAFGALRRRQKAVRV